MNKEELFYEAESKTSRPHKYSIKYKNDDVIYPTMVIRSQAETIELLEKENKELKELYRRTCNHLFNIGNDELAEYFQAQINDCPTFSPQRSDSDD